MGERLKSWAGDTAVKQALVIFVLLRIFLSLWAVVALTASPLPAEPDEELRPYLGEPQLTEGAAGLLLGPWQRFDTQHYLRIARQGYADESDSVFPPLYPLAIRLLGGLLGGGPVPNLLAGTIVANVACLALLILLYRVVAAELDPATATRTLVYLVLFPTGFFLFAPYTESLFLLFALGAVWAARRGRFWTAGVLGFLASLTRLTGWILLVPLAYAYWRQQRQQEAGRAAGSLALHLPIPAFRLSLVTPLLPPLGLAAFMAWRWWAGLPPLSEIYQQYWYQTTGFPGADLFTAVNSMFFGGVARAGEVTLYFDFVCALLLIGTTALVFRRLGVTYGLYSAMLLLFILLPTSELKPLYSFSRYTLVFFPTFMLLGMGGKRPWANRLILYPSLALYLYFSGQFFIWGWVA